MEVNSILIIYTIIPEIGIGLDGTTKWKLLHLSGYFDESRRFSAVPNISDIRLFPYISISQSDYNCFWCVEGLCDSLLFSIEPSGSLAYPVESIDTMGLLKVISLIRPPYYWAQNEGTSTILTHLVWHHREANFLMSYGRLIDKTTAVIWCPILALGSGVSLNQPD